VLPTRSKDLDSQDIRDLPLSGGAFGAQLKAGKAKRGMSAESRPGGRLRPDGDVDIA
jgi:hypothetical protein